MHMLDVMVEFDGKVLLAEEEVTQMVSEDHVLSRLILNDKVIFCIQSNMHQSKLKGILTWC